MSVSFRVGFVHGLQRHRMTRGGHAYDTERNIIDNVPREPEVKADVRP